MDRFRQSVPNLGIDCWTGGQSNHCVREEPESGFSCIRVPEFVEKGGNSLSGEAPIVGRKLVNREEEMRGKQEHPVGLHAAPQFGQCRSRVLYMLDRVEQEHRAYGFIPETQPVKILKLVDSQSESHIGSREGTSRKYGLNGRKMGLAGDAESPELDDRFRHVGSVG